MKKIFSILFLSVIVLTGCSSDDDSSNTVDISQLVGSWNYTDYFTTATTTFTVNGQTTELVGVTEFVSTNGATYTFNADNTYISSGIITVAYTQNGQTTNNDFDITDSGTYSVNMNEITVTNSFGQSEVFNISTLTANRLVLDLNKEIEISADQSSRIVGFIELTR